MKVILWRRVILLVAAIVIVVVAVAVIVNRTNSGQPSSVTTTKVVKLTPAQVRAKKERAARVAARLAAQAKKEAAAQAARAKKQAAQARREAAAQAAAVAAANAWHKGYQQQDANVYWRWHHGGSCQDFATNGCWHVEVITDNGCNSYVAVNANEYSGTAIVGSLLDNQGYGIPPRTARIFELDADAASVTAGDVQVDCS